MAEIKTRINKYDNLKGLAIFLIVLGHMCYLRHFPIINFIHTFVRIIHLPMFFFVAGYFSKIDSDEPIKAFRRLFIPFVVLCIIHALFSQYILMKTPKALFIHPGWTLWFLISLFTMKMVLPILDKLRYPVLTSFVVAMLIGYVDCNILGLSRTFAYLPIFLIGFYYDDYKELLYAKYADKYNLEDKKMIIFISILTLICLIISAMIIPLKIINFKCAFSSFNLTELIMRGGGDYFGNCCNTGFK